MTANREGAAGPTALEARLKADLRRALAAGDRPAVTALRTVIAAIDNSGSVALPEEATRWSVGSSPDVPRREPTEAEVAGMLRREVAELEEGISAAERHGDGGRSRELGARRAALLPYLEP